MTQAQPMAPRSVADEVALAVQGLRRAAAAGFQRRADRQLDGGGQRTSPVSTPRAVYRIAAVVVRFRRTQPPSGLTSIGGDVSSRAQTAQTSASSIAGQKATDGADMLFGLVSLVD